MKIARKVWKTLTQGRDDAGDALARLLMAAKEDSGFRARVLSVLRAPTLQRESLIHTAVDEMRLRGESEAACAAFATLATEEGAKTALRILEEK